MTSSCQLVSLCALLTVLAFSGCASNPPKNSAYPLEQMDGQSVGVAAGTLDRLGEENQRLKTNNIQLLAENVELKKTVLTLNKYLQINNCLSTNKEAIAQNLIEIWTPHRDALWKAQGGTGMVVDFTVQDVVFFDGYVVVATLFLAKNQDQTGILAKGAVALDPDKNLEIAACAMDEHSTLSPQDMAQLTSESQIEERAKTIPAQPNKDGEWRISQENKDKAVGAGIAIGATLLYKLLDNYINQ